MLVRWRYQLIRSQARSQARSIASKLGLIVLRVSNKHCWEITSTLPRIRISRISFRCIIRLDHLGFEFDPNERV